MLDKTNNCFKSNKQVREIKVILKDTLFKNFFNSFISFQINFEFYLTSSNKKTDKARKKHFKV